jgi:hypothetical protein
MDYHVTYPIIELVIMENQKTAQEETAWGNNREC